VRRVADPEDARAKIVRLTTRGRTYVAESRRQLQAVEGRARRGLGDRRYEQVRAALEWMAGEEEDEAE
jgi:DNA-binding MarR family transcriptional regulator